MLKKTTICWLLFLSMTALSVATIADDQDQGSGTSTPIQETLASQTALKKSSNDLSVFTNDINKAKDFIKKTCGMGSSDCDDLFNFIGNDSKPFLSPFKSYFVIADGGFASYSNFKVTLQFFKDQDAQDKNITSWSQTYRVWNTPSFLLHIDEWSWEIYTPDQN